MNEILKQIDCGGVAVIAGITLIPDHFRVRLFAVNAENLYGSNIWNSNSKYKKDYKTAEKLCYNPFFYFV